MAKKKEEKQEPIKEVEIPMKDKTEHFSQMIEAFECDFVLARDSGKSLIEIQTALQSKNEKLLKDIELLEYLSFGIRLKNVCAHSTQGIPNSGLNPKRRRIVSDACERARFENSGLRKISSSKSSAFSTLGIVHSISPKNSLPITLCKNS